MEFAAKNIDIVRWDIQFSLKLLEKLGFLLYFYALKQGSVFNEIVGPMIMYGLREQSAQTEGLFSTRI